MKLLKNPQNPSKLLKTLKFFFKLSQNISYLRILCVLFYSAFLLSCKESDVFFSQQSLPVPSLGGARVNSGTDDEIVILGKKRTNPYSLVNINKALNALKNTNYPKKVEANYYYARLEPTDSVAFRFLERTREIYGYQAPLDYKLENNGSKYKEPDYTGEFQVFWAAIPVGFKLPENIKETKLDDLFLPFGDGHDNGFAKGYDEGFLKQLEMKTLELHDEDFKNTKKAKISAYGSGQINVFDDYLVSFLPIAGVEVKMKRWFTTRYATTNATGGFVNNTYDFNGPIDYSINWINLKYELINGNSGIAGTNQNNIPGYWQANIGTTNGIYGNIKQTESYIFAHVFRAAFHYYYFNGLYSIKTPPQPNSSILGSGKLNIKCKNNALAGSHFFFTNGGGLVDPSVVIESSTSSAADISSLRLFATTIHELSHASHWELGFTASDYSGSKKKATLAESWAMGVEWVITNKVYQTLATNLGKSWTNYERPDRATQPKPINFWLFYPSGSTTSTNRDDFYTPVFIDLMDNTNQNSSFPSVPIIFYNGATATPSLPPNDVSSGFILSFLEQKLITQPKEWNVLRDIIKIGNITSSPNSNIDFLFATYENY